MSSLKLELFADLFWLSALHERIFYMVYREGNIFVDFSLFFLHYRYNINFMNKPKFNLFFLNPNKIKKSLTVQTFFNLQNHPVSTQREGWSTQEEEESALLVYVYY